MPKYNKYTGNLPIQLILYYKFTYFATTNEKYIGTYIYGDIRIENGITRIIDDITFNKVSDDDELTIVFNAKENQSKTINVPQIDKIESSFLGDSGQPKYKASTFSRCFFIANFRNLISA